MRHATTVAILLWPLCAAMLTAQNDCPEADEAAFEDLARVLFQENYGRTYPDGAAVGECTFGYEVTYPAAQQCSTGIEAHAGIDFRSRSRENVYSPVGGRMTAVCRGDFNTTGVHVVDPEDPADPGYTVLFLHLSRCDVRAGQEVKAGDLIGQSGAVGAGAAHLHLEVRSGQRVSPCCTNTEGCSNPTCNFSCQATVEANTDDPLSTIFSTVFIRDTEDNVRADQIQQDEGLLVIHGLNFGDESGNIEIKINLGDEPDYSSCHPGDPMYTWEVSDVDSWTNNEIHVDIFPEQVPLCVAGEALDLEATTLNKSLFVRVENILGERTNYLPFPFKDVFSALPDLQSGELGGDLEVWWAKPLMHGWRASVVNGKKKRRSAVEVEQVAINRYDSADPVTRAEILKMAVESSGIPLPALPDNPNEDICDCQGVGRDHWAHRHVCAALDNGWDVACPFQPDIASRRDFTALLVAANTGMEEDAVIRQIYDDVLIDDFDPETDPELARIYRAITYCFDEGIMAGNRLANGDREFRPEASLNRAEAVMVIDRAFLNIGERVDVADGGEQ